MTASAKTKKAKQEAARALVSRIVDHMAARTLVARYDSLRRDPLRKQPEIRTDATCTEQYFRADKRILAYLQCDDLADNTGIGATLDTCVRLTVGMKGGNPMFTGQDREFWQATFDEWKKSCGYDEDEPLQEMLKQILRMVKLHGDCIVWIDKSLTLGKLRVYDADQICNVGDFDAWKSDNGHPTWRQVEGVVMDETGRVQGYFVTMLRNRYSVDSADATFLPASACRRISYHRKHTGYRGEPSLLANQKISQDTNDLIQSEIGAAKLSAEMPLVVEEPPDATDADLAQITAGFDPDELLSGTGISDDTLKAMSETTDMVKTFEAFKGRAAVVKVSNGAKVTNVGSQGRPGQQIQSWLDNLADSNGRTLGVMSCLSRGRADNSYSSGQIEIAISWAAFEEDQKMLERGVIDYACSILCPHQPYFVSWPKAFEIDPEKAEKTIEAKLRAGLTSYRQVLGPDWEEELAHLAYERKRIVEMGLDSLPFFQTSSGAQIEAPATTEETDLNA